MALAARFLSKSSRQVYAGQRFIRSEYAVPVRSFAKGADGAPPADLKKSAGSPPANSKKSDGVPPSFLKIAMKGDEMLKGIFLDVKKKFDTAIGILKKEKITIDPEDPAAVAHYAKVMKTIREKADLLSESQRIKYTIDSRTQDIPDVRSYLLSVKDIRVKRGIVDELGAEVMMMDALNKVENELKKPLLRNDKKGMALLKAEFDKVNEKLGIRPEDLPKYEQQLELKIAKAHLEELKKDALEAMETQKKREEFKDEEIPDVKSLDIRNFL